MWPVSPTTWLRGPRAEAVSGQENTNDNHAQHQRPHHRDRQGYLERSPLRFSPEGIQGDRAEVWGGRNGQHHPVDGAATSAHAWLSRRRDTAGSMIPLSPRNVRRSEVRPSSSDAPPRGTTRLDAILDRLGSLTEGEAAELVREARGLLWQTL